MLVGIKAKSYSENKHSKRNILELEKDHIYQKYKERVGDIITGEVYQIWKREILIIDDEDQECAIGEPGELCIRSSTLTKGYWNRPDLNERVYLYLESFGPFPDVYFRTGDMVVRHEDGLLRFLGRKDRMVKTRGNRVELDEVEAAFATHASVSEAAAFVVPDDHGSKSILAAVKLSDGADVTTAELTKHAGTKLPGYALPQQLFIVEEFPRTTSGKIDRRELVSELTNQDAS